MTTPCDFDKARASFFAKRRKAKAANPEAKCTATWKFRSRRDPQQTLVIRHRDWGKKRGAYSGIFGADVLKRASSDAQALPPKMEPTFASCTHVSVMSLWSCPSAWRRRARAKLRRPTCRV